MGSPGLAEPELRTLTKGRGASSFGLHLFTVSFDGFLFLHSSGSFSAANHLMLFSSSCSRSSHSISPFLFSSFPDFPRHSIFLSCFFHCRRFLPKTFVTLFLFSALRRPLKPSFKALAFCTALCFLPFSLRPQPVGFFS